MTEKRPSWITRGVLGIVLATFFSDVGHEMVTAVLPLYLATVGLGPALLGVMEGLADLAFSLSKLAGGVVGHRTTRKKPLAAAGYTTTALASAAMALAPGAVAVAALRVVAWCGRGFRSPLRDLMLADEVAPTHFGRAYGFERTADMLGAVAGPLLALGLLWLGLAVPTLLALSIVPALLAVAFLVVFTHDRAHPGEAPRGQTTTSRLPRAFWVFLIGVLIFGVGDFSRTFLIYLAVDVMGGSDTPGAFGAGVLAYTIHNVISGLTAFPIGRHADRLSKRRLLIFGYALGMATNLVLAFASQSVVGLALAVLGSGIYIAVQETVEKAAVAELLPREQRSLSFGILAFANAIGDMISSLYVGLLLAAGRPGLAFGLAAGFGAAGVCWLCLAARTISTRSSA